ncbi:cytochrome P450 [Streptomyces sp. NPDC094032]|uniref:cytochrome P450 n=1 Tax=Streptomyces sp. NPDC094032 TaxID=3155308 RepID=UPI00331CF8C1
MSAAQETAAATYGFDLTDSAFHRDPYPVYRRLREAAPAVLLPYGSWVVTRFSEVSALLRDARLRTDFPTDPRWVERHGGPDAPTVADGRHWMLLNEGPDHRGTRRLFTHFFTPAAVEGHRRRVGSVVGAVLDGLERGAAVDVVADVAEPIVAASMCELLGLPPAHKERYAAWSATISRMTDPVPGSGVRDQVGAAMERFRTHIEGLARGGGLAGIAAELLDGGRCEAEARVIVANLVMLAMAGTDTTVSQIALAVRALLDGTERPAWALSDPESAERAVPELARYDGPVQLVTRRAVEPLRVGDAEIPAGAKVMLCLGAANRDERRYRSAHRLDPHRPDVAALPFGDGAHYCLGARMGRMVVGTTLAELFRRYPSLRPAHPWDRLDWRPSVVARRPETLPAVLA